MTIIFLFDSYRYTCDADQSCSICSSEELSRNDINIFTRLQGAHLQVISSCEVYSHNVKIMNTSGNYQILHLIEGYKCWIFSASIFNIEF